MGEAGGICAICLRRAVSLFCFWGVKALRFVSGRCAARRREVFSPRILGERRGTRLLEATGLLFAAGVWGFRGVLQLERAWFFKCGGCRRRAAARAAQTQTRKEKGTCLKPMKQRLNN